MKKTDIATKTKPTIEKNTALRMMILVEITLLVNVSFYNQTCLYKWIFDLNTHIANTLQWSKPWGFSCSNRVPFKHWPLRTTANRCRLSRMSHAKWHKSTMQSIKSSLKITIYTVGQQNWINSSLTIINANAGILMRFHLIQNWLKHIGFKTI